MKYNLIFYIFSKNKSEPENKEHINAGRTRSPRLSTLKYSSRTSPMATFFHINIPMLVLFQYRLDFMIFFFAMMVVMQDSYLHCNP